MASKIFGFSSLVVRSLNVIQSTSESFKLLRKAAASVRGLLRLSRSGWHLGWQLGIAWGCKQVCRMIGSQQGAWSGICATRVGSLPASRHICLSSPSLLCHQPFPLHTRQLPLQQLPQDKGEDNDYHTCHHHHNNGTVVTPVTTHEAMMTTATTKATTRWCQQSQREKWL